MATFTSQGTPAPETPRQTETPDVDAAPDEVATSEQPGTDVAVNNGHNGQLAIAETDWSHDKLEFNGDVLGIRKPTQQALVAFSLASSKHVSRETQNDIIGLFIARHLSPASYGRVFSRLMDPDDPDYSVETIGELMRAVVSTAVDGKQG